MQRYVLFRTRLRLFVRTARSGARLSGAPARIIEALDRAEEMLHRIEEVRDVWARADAIEAAEQALTDYRGWLGAATSCGRT